MKRTEISIEFFPPQTPEGVDKLRTTRAKLAELKPEFFSVTYSAGGRRASAPSPSCAK